MKQTVLTSKVRHYGEAPRLDSKEQRGVTVSKNLIVQFSGLCLEKIWGYSSAGRAPALQAGGLRFDPAYLHQKEEPRLEARK